MQRRNGIRKSAVRCKVEHAFKIIKDTFGFRKVRYRGLAKKFQQAECAVCVCQFADGKTWTNKKSEGTYKGISVPFCR